MGSVVAIGADNEIAGFALAGVEVHPVGDDDAARLVWEALPGDVSLVILTATVARALDAAPAGPLRVVMPS